MFEIEIVEKLTSYNLLQQLEEQGLLNQRLFYHWYRSLPSTNEEYAIDDWIFSVFDILDKCRNGWRERRA